MRKNSFLFIIFSFFLILDLAEAKGLTVIYTGSTHSTLFPCHCPKEPAGGISRRATKTRELRRENPNLVLLEAGDSFAGGEKDYNKQTQELDEKRTLVYFKSLEIMGYDAVGLGPDIYVYGKKFFDKVRRESKLNFIALKTRGVKPYLIKDIGEIRIGVVGFGKYKTQNVDYSGSYINHIRGLIKKLKADGVDIVILLSSDNLDDIFTLVGEVEKIDCVITTALRSRNQKQVIKVCDTLVAFSYWQARRLSRLDLDIEDGKIIDFSASEIKLTPEVDDDIEIEKLLKKYPDFKR